MEPVPATDSADHQITVTEYDNDTNYERLTPAQKAAYLVQVERHLAEPGGTRWLDWIEARPCYSIRTDYVQMIGEPAKTLASGLVRERVPHLGDSDFRLERYALTPDEWSQYLNKIVGMLRKGGDRQRIIQWLDANPDLKGRFVDAHGDPAKIAAEARSGPPKVKSRPREWALADLVRVLEDKCGGILPRGQHDLVTMSSDTLDKLLPALHQFRRNTYAKKAIAQILGSDCLEVYRPLRDRYLSWVATSQLRTGPQFSTLNDDLDNKLAGHLTVKARHNLATTSREMHARFSDHDGVSYDIDQSLWRLAGESADGRTFPAEMLTAMPPAQRTKLVKFLADMVERRGDSPACAEWLNQPRNHAIRELVDRYQRTSSRRMRSMPDGSSRWFAVDRHGRVSSSRLTAAARKDLLQVMKANPNLGTCLAAVSGLTPTAVKAFLDDRRRPTALGNDQLSPPDIEKVLAAICLVVIRTNSGVADRLRSGYPGVIPDLETFVKQRLPRALAPERTKLLEFVARK